MTDLDEDRLLDLDPFCPVCALRHEVGEVFDGSERRCWSCGARLVAVAYTDGTMSMVEVERFQWRLTGRARTRALWRRRGRR